jgi:putative endonuclease
MPFQVYIIQSLLDNSYYIGYTKNLEKRIVQHNNAKTGYSSKKVPWILVYSESFEIKSLAIKRERFIKNQKSRDFIKKLISG